MFFLVFMFASNIMNFEAPNGYSHLITDENCPFISDSIITTGDKCETPLETFLECPLELESIQHINALPVLDPYVVDHALSVEENDPVMTQLVEWPVSDLLEPPVTAVEREPLSRISRKTSESSCALDVQNERPKIITRLETLCLSVFVDGDETSNASPLSPVSSELKPLLQRLEIDGKRRSSSTSEVFTNWSSEQSDCVFSDDDELEMSIKTDPKGAYHKAVKQELKYKIKLRRLVSKQQEIIIEDKDTRKSTLDSTRPQESRRERNKWHAKTSREKAKKFFQELIENDKTLRNGNQELEIKIKEMASTISSMESWLKRHNRHCKFGRQNSI